MTEIGLNGSDLYTDHISILNIPSSSNVQVINCTTPRFNFNSTADGDCIHAEDFINNLLSRPLDDFSGHVCIYIAGYLARKIVKTVKCCLCQVLVIGDKQDFLFSIINVKDRGGLTYPSQGLIKIIKNCKKVYKVAENITANFLVNSWEHTDYNQIFYPGSGDSDHDAEHLFLLVKVIINYYVNLRNKHIAREKKDLSKRNLFKKMVLFHNM